MLPLCHSIRSSVFLSFGAAPIVHLRLDWWPFTARLVFDEDTLLVYDSRLEALLIPTLFHLTQSSNFTPSPPKMSRALPMVRSILPQLNRLTRSRSPSCLPPPAYVTGILHHSANLSTNASSIPDWRPSLSAAWMRNSEQYGSRDLMDSKFKVSVTDSSTYQAQAYFRRLPYP
jgi:hypothetical protein